MTDEKVKDHRTNCMMMLLAICSCMLTVYLNLRSVNILVVCNSTPPEFLEEEAVELTAFGFDEVSTSSHEIPLNGSWEIAVQC